MLGPSPSKSGAASTAKTNHRPPMRRGATGSVPDIRLACTADLERYGQPNATSAADRGLTAPPKAACAAATAVGLGVADIYDLRCRRRPPNTKGQRPATGMLTSEYRLNDAWLERPDALQLTTLFGAIPATRWSPNQKFAKWLSGRQGSEFRCATVVRKTRVRTHSQMRVGQRYPGHKAFTTSMQRPNLPAPAHTLRRTELTSPACRQALAGWPPVEA